MAVIDTGDFQRVVFVGYGDEGASWNDLVKDPQAHTPPRETGSLLICAARRDGAIQNLLALSLLLRTARLTTTP